MPGEAGGEPALRACLEDGGGPQGLPPYLAQSSGTTGDGEWKEQRVFRDVNKGC